MNEVVGGEYKQQPIGDQPMLLLPVSAPKSLTACAHGGFKGKLFGLKIMCQDVVGTIVFMQWVFN